jgi:dynein heavy chain 1
MEQVQGKVNHSMRLLESLSLERARWEAGSRTFDMEMSIIVGNVLPSAAFLAYSGFFDQHYCEVMWQEWINHLTKANIKFKPELSFTEYLSTADDRLSWQSRVDGWWTVDRTHMPIQMYGHTRSTVRCAPLLASLVLLVVS